MTVVCRPIDPRTEAIVAQALVERFRMDACEHCGGPRVYSKVTPRAKCMACGHVTELAIIKPSERRWTCDRCRKRFYAVHGTAKCPNCVAELKAEAKKQATGLRTYDQPKNRAVNIGVSRGDSDARSDSVDKTEKPSVE